MSYMFSPELDRLVQLKMATGEYESEDQLLVEAIHALDDLRNQQEQLRSEIKERLLESGKGYSRPLDLEQFQAEARRRLAEENREK